MPKFHFTSAQREGQSVVFTGDEFHHIRRVRRLQIGDRLYAFDENGETYQLEIIKTSSQNLTAHIIEQVSIETESSLEIVLYQAIPKKQGMDTIIKQGTQLGINRFVPILTSRTVVRVNVETVARKMARWNRIARESAKQCGRNMIPQIDSPVHLSQIEDTRDKEGVFIVLHEKAQIQLAKLMETKQNVHHVRIIVGPEGGFDHQEIKILIQKGFSAVQLGARILRSETAGMVVASILQFTFGDLGATEQG